MIASHSDSIEGQITCTLENLQDQLKLVNPFVLHLQLKLRVEHCDSIFTNIDAPLVLSIGRTVRDDTWSLSSSCHLGCPVVENRNVVQLRTTVLGRRPGNTSESRTIVYR